MLVPDDENATLDDHGKQLAPWNISSCVASAVITQPQEHGGFHPLAPVVTNCLRLADVQRDPAASSSSQCEQIASANLAVHTALRTL